MNLYTVESGERHPSSGVALIIVLGLLAMLLLLSVTFFSAMRTERLVSRNYADDVRARNLAEVALVRAMEDVDSTMSGRCYPNWEPLADAMSSTGRTAATDILNGEAAAFIPGALSNDAYAAALVCCWSNIVPFDGNTSGRISYLVVNCSGLLDANIVGGMDRTCSTNVNELSLRHLPDFGSDGSKEDKFYTNNRAKAIRYETIAELAKLNPTVLTDPVSNLFIYSYDPGRDVYFTNFVNRGALGSEDIVLSLTNKLNINDTNAPNYWENLTNALVQAGYAANAGIVASNIMDYIDQDRTPRNGADKSYLDDTACEDVPLINEVALDQIDPSNYMFTIELWYPFVPNAITDGFRLNMGIYSQQSGEPFSNCEFQIGPMEFGNTNNEFRTFTSDPFTNIPIWFLARVFDTNNACVDQAMDPLPFPFTGPAAYSVNDPRCNGNSNQWLSAPETLGRMNTNTVCHPWRDGGQGIPIHHRDGPMQSIGELGYIFTGQPWQDIQLVDYQPTNIVHFALPDLLTVRSNNPPARGLVNISSQQNDVLEALFYDMVIGYKNAFTDITVSIDAGESNKLWGVIDGPYVNFRELFNSVATSPGYSNWSPGSYKGVPDNSLCSDLKEDAFRNILEMLTFRQNIFTVIVAAQVYAPASTNIVAEKRAVAVVYRDAYTGRSFTRFFKWLQD